MEMIIPAGCSEIEYIERGSRFIGEALGVGSPEEGKTEILRRREKYPDASHVVYAFVLGPEKSRSYGMSDDGEPKGTAGRPVLEVLKGSGVTNLLVTVVRYFGGTKLGTGGLVRAYTESAKQAIAELPVKTFITEIVFAMGLPYGIYEPACRIIDECRGKRITEEFGTSVQVTGSVPEPAFSDFKDRIMTLSRGAVEVLPC